MFGGVLAEAVLAGVHQRGDLGDVGAAFGVGDAGDLRGPRDRRERDRAAEPVPDPGVDDGGHVAGAGQVPFGDGVGQDLRGVQAGQFGGAQGAPQPPGLVARLAAVFGGQGGQEQVAVALLAGGGGLGGPDGVQHGQVVGVGEGLVAGLGGRELLAVMVQDGCEHAQRRARLGRPGFRGGNAGSFGLNLVVAGQLGRWPRAGHWVRLLRGGGEHVREVGVGTAGQRDVGVLAVLGPGDHRQAGVHGPAHARRDR